MAEFVSSFDKLMIKSPASSSSSAADGSFEEVCSVCLDPFSIDDPSTVTSCKHEYHLQCILEWSQRSKDCPICWQDLVLQDPSSQELLTAVEDERALRTRRRSSPNISTILYNFHEYPDIDHDDSYSDETDYDERITEQLAIAASRARYVCRRGRHGTSGLNPIEALFSPPSINMPDDENQTRISSEELDYSGYGISVGDSSNSILHSTVIVQPPLSAGSPVGNTVPIAPVSQDSPFKIRFLGSESPPNNPQYLSQNELSFSESMKQKLSAASSRCKESISKGTQGFKEKLLARNASVKELSKGAQREMNAGIAGFAKVLERYDFTSPKRFGSSVSDSTCTERTSNVSFKGKRVLDQSHNGNDGDDPHAISYITIPGRVEVSPAQTGQ